VNEKDEKDGADTINSLNLIDGIKKLRLRKREDGVEVCVIYDYGDVIDLLFTNLSWAEVHTVRQWFDAVDDKRKDE